MWRMLLLSVAGHELLIIHVVGGMAMCAGLAGPIPALFLLNQDYSVGSLMLWGVSVGFLGIFFAGADEKAK